MLRSITGVLACLGAAYFALMVPLGKKTLIQHLQAIGQTKEAHELMDGAKSTVQPTLREAKDRLVGEIARAPSQTNLAPRPATTNATATSTAGTGPAKPREAPAKAASPLKP